MRIPRPFFFATLCFLALFAGTFRIAHAQALVFQRGDGLYVTGAADTPSPYRIATIGNAPDVLWAATPDGRRVAWLTRTGGKNGANASDTVSDAANAMVNATVPAGLAARPAVVTLEDIYGTHRKRLFATDMLRTRTGQPVTTLGLGDADSGAFEDWEPVSLSWSADGRTLYLSCLSFSGKGGKATFAVDGASGLALIDAEGRWKSIAPATYLDARGELLVGSGLARYGTAGNGGNGGNAGTAGVPTRRYGPLLLIDLAEGTRSPLYAAPASDGAILPDYAFATNPVLSPDLRRIAFTSPSKGLWIIDIKARAYRRLVEGDVRCPHWTADGKTLLFLLPRPNANDAPTYDLYALDMPKTLLADAPVPPFRLVLQSVDAFALLPQLN